MVFLFQLIKNCCLSLPSLDLGTQVLPLGFQLAHNVFTLLQKSLQVLDLLILIPNLTQHLFQVVLQYEDKPTQEKGYSRCFGR